ncbi:MAG TPA: DUF2017 family protein [Acidimicrobiales bacterium]|nr:DUF2017 family protein [Acidimicrobiales bacterium]
MSSTIRRRRDGRYVIRLDANTRIVLADLARQLPAAIASRDPMVRRLFPPAYPTPELAGAERDYRELVDTALVNHHTQALEVLVATARAETLSGSEFHSWLDAIGSLRLVLGTRLDVHEDMGVPDPEDPMAAEYALFVFLGELQYLMVEALADDLPDEGRPEGDL